MLKGYLVVAKKHDLNDQNIYVSSTTTNLNGNKFSLNHFLNYLNDSCFHNSISISNSLAQNFEQINIHFNKATTLQQSNIIYYNNLILLIIVISILVSLFLISEDSNLFTNLTAISFLLIITFSLIVFILAHNLKLQFLKSHSNLIINKRMIEDYIGFYHYYSLQI
jgi:positive regulator of sigma E activity